MSSHHAEQPKVSVRSLVPGQEIENAVFWCKYVTEGAGFRRVGLRDRTGSSILGIGFDEVPGLGQYCQPNQAVRISGIVEKHNGARNIKIHAVAPASSEEIGALVPKAKRDPEDMLGALEYLASRVQDPFFRVLIGALLLENEAAIDGLRRMPASGAGCDIPKYGVYAAGLLEDIYCLALLAEVLCEIYPQLDFDLVITASLLQNLDLRNAFLEVVDFPLVSPERWKEHPANSAELVRKVAERIPGYPEKRLGALVHCIEMHHKPDGRTFDSPEAKMLWHVNVLQSEVKAALERHDAKLGGNGLSGGWLRAVVEEEQVGPLPGWGPIEHLVSRVGQEHYYGLLVSVFSDPTLADAIRNGRCNKQHGHHNYKGGLLKQMISVARAAQVLCRLHPQLNSDLLMTAVLLHLVGHTLRFDRGEPDGWSYRGRHRGRSGPELLSVEILSDHWRRMLEQDDESGDPRRAQALDELKIDLEHCIESTIQREQSPASPAAKALRRLFDLDSGVELELRRDMKKKSKLSQSSS